MKYSRFFCIIIAAALLFSLCSCGKTDYTKKAISFRTTEKISTLDPQLAFTAAEITAVVNCFDGLMMIDENGKIAGCAAEKYEVSNDGLTYKFTLRKNMLWADEKTNVTADDFVYGLTRALLPETKAPFASLLYCIKNAKSVNSGKTKAASLGVKATSETELTITLGSADHNFLQTLTHPVAMPCNRAFFDSTSGKYGLDDDNVLCNGAYNLKLWNNEDNYLSLTRFKQHNGKSAIPASVTIGFSREYADIASSLKSEDLNMGMLTGDFASELPTDSCKSQAFYNTSFVLLFSPSVSSAMRKALVYDIDIDSLHMNLPAFYDKSASVLPISATEGNLQYRKTAGALNVQKYAPSNAKKLMNQLKSNAGEDGIDFSKYTLYYPTGDADVKKTAGLIAQKWQNELNAFINTAEYTDSDLLQQLSSGKINIAIVPVTSVTGSATDAAASLNVLGISQYNSKIANLSDNITECCAALKSAEQYLINNFYAVPLFCEPVFCGMTSNINGAVFNASGNYIDFRFIKKED